ncbi:MAG: HAMP domain-containing sensor histidine kinase [Bacteroidota bacterium]
MNKLPILIIASTIAIVALIIFQVNWIMQSKNLLEEQFDQRVSLALCNAVENLSRNEGMCRALNSCGENHEKAKCCELDFDSLTNAVEFKKTLNAALEFYNIELDYQIKIDKRSSPGDAEDKLFHQCTLQPITKKKNLALRIYFPGKTRYILGKMSFMLVSSILILIFITIVFILTNITLWKQKRITGINIDFFNNLAHEFKTPLTNISLAVNMFSKKRKDSADDNFVKVIESENKKLMGQVERVLHVARLENGEYMLEKEQFDVHQLLQDVTESMKILSKEKGGEIQLSLKSSNSSIIADKYHLTNVFNNIIDNALKYTDKPPEINISTISKDDGIIISFRDNGVGINSKDQGLIFDKFQRVATGDVHTNKGFGLGLSYAKMIIELHKGNIKVKSELNKGSQFDVFLPV